MTVTVTSSYLTQYLLTCLEKNQFSLLGMLVGKYTVWFSAIGCPVCPWRFLRPWPVFSTVSLAGCGPLGILCSVIYGVPLFLSCCWLSLRAQVDCLVECSSCVFLFPRVWGGTQWKGCCAHVGHCTRRHRVLVVLSWRHVTVEAGEGFLRQIIVSYLRKATI